jgi:uncharacterized membrane protein YedE/YeeE
MMEAVAMSNPLLMKAWSPYVVGAGIGMLSWFAFATADKHLAITLQYEHIAALVEKATIPQIGEWSRYFTVRAEQGLSPTIGWYMMLIVGVFFGALVSSLLSDDRAKIKVPSLWQWRFGPSVSLRFAFAFLGGAVMVFGARLAGGCTSGHGISGDLQLAASSWIFMPLAFLVAMLTAFVLYGKEGRRYV